MKKAKGEFTVDGLVAAIRSSAKKIKADLRPKTQDIVTVLGQEISQARQMLRKLLAGKIILDPTDSAGQKDRGYRFQATLTLDRLIAGEATNRIRMGLVAPTGFAHRTSYSLRRFGPCRLESIAKAERRGNHVRSPPTQVDEGALSTPERAVVLEAGGQKRRSSPRP